MGFDRSRVRRAWDALRLWAGPRRRALGIAGAALALVALLLATLAVVTAHRPTTRDYWIAAVPIQWNIVPTEMDDLSGATFRDKSTSYDALIYRPYTANWAAPLADPHGGMPGPLLYGEVGDTLLIHFKNLDSHFHRPHSMHPHGVHYAPASDGSYIQGDKQPGGAVPEGGTFTYRWTVGDDSVGVWVYHDHSQDAMDNTTRGLYGNLVLARPGDRPPDVRLLVFFTELPADVTGLSQEFDTINGHAYLGNTPTYTARVGQRVEWVFSALGSDFHSFHVHGHRWLDGGQFADVLKLGPAEAKTVSYIEDAPGSWLIHCHVDEHMMNGMTARYLVRK
jgi:FtsP/CotA-like multicopper oxidase with cupredoxin domain